MHLRLLLVGSLFALAAGCQTPPKVKALSTVTHDETQKVMKGYGDDLAGAATYIAAQKNAQLKLDAVARQSDANSRELLEAWRKAAEQAATLQALAAWDAKATELISRDFPATVVQDYFPRINAKLRPLRADARAKQQAAAAAPGNTALAYEAAVAVAVVAETEHQASDALIKLYDFLHDEVARRRLELLKDLKLDGTTGLTVVTPKLPSAAAMPDSVNAEKDPELKRLADRRKEISDVADAQEKALSAIDHYLQTDGYSRVLAKEAVAGLAEGLVQEAGGALKVAKLPEAAAKLAEKLGLPSEVAQSVKEQTEKVTAEVVSKAQSALQDFLNTQLTKAETYATSLAKDLKTKLGESATRVEADAKP